MSASGHLPGIPTSSRRARSSIGPSDVAGMDGAAQHSVDLEFRRKHSRQNKEIIAENVQHKSSIKVLRDEITSLKEELLEVKHANRIMAGRVTALRKERTSARTSDGLAALDTLLDALPALQQLRTQLTPELHELPPIRYEVTRTNLLRNMGMSIATRPAASGGQSRGLGPLSEEEADQIVFNDSSITAVPSRANTLTGRSAPRSPNPLGLRRPPPPTCVVTSPASSASPSPRKRAVPSPRRKPRRRRESGLLPPPRTNDRTLTSPSISPSRSNNVDPEWTDDVDDPMAGAGEIMAADAVAAPCADALVDGSDPSRSSQLSPTSSLSDVLSPSLAVATTLEEDSKRGRRPRSSVNYKEPSLTKKMRKPDGVAVADMLGQRRGSLVSGVMPEMALPRPGMRRKSVLPRSQAKLSDPSSLEDEDDVEDSLLPVLREGSPPSSSSDRSSGLSDAPSSSSRSASTRGDISAFGASDSGIDRVPTPIPSVEAEPTLGEIAAQAPAAPLHTRTSPRKQTVSSQSKIRQPSTATTRPRPSRVFTPSSRAREALAAMAAPNVPDKVSRSSTVAASGGKRL